MHLAELVGRKRAAGWVLVSLAILAVDHATGPFIHLSVLFVIPVMLATLSHGPVAGAALATILPFIRLPFFLAWHAPPFWTLRLIDAAVETAILIGFVLLVTRSMRLQRQIRLLEGMLPICSFCKRIRDEGGQWHRLEAFIGERSGARFSHTFCEECGRKHYGALAD
jgi:hypothetical protein